MYIENCLVKSNMKIIDDVYKMEFENQKIAQAGKAGQFLQVKVNSCDTPLLRRPISINEIRVEENIIVIYYKVVGKGTNILSNVSSGEVINVIGPLGTGFEIEKAGKNIAIVGGGIGLAPLIQLGKDLNQNNNIHSFLGFNDCTYLVEEFNEFSDSINISTVSGRVGYKGFIVDVLDEYLESNSIDIIYTCGPKAMLKAVKEIATKRNIKCQVSLEERMACGIGACLGCSIETTDGKMKKVCHDGPVFWSDEVILND